MRRQLALVTVGWIVMIAAAQAQGIVLQRNLSLGLARTIAEAALAACQAQGYHTSVAVVDRTGQLMVLLRDEQAGPVTIEMARRKAYTARMFSMATVDFQKRTAGDVPAAGQRDVGDMLALSGGIPIRAAGETIGGVGSSGAGLEPDDACARAGVAAVEEQLRAAE
jgi:uncharacterized protein GlcG (DUF336 family)